MVGFILYSIYRTLNVLVSIINFVLVSIKNAKKHGYLKAMSDYWYSDAFEGDVYANRQYRTLWNTIFIKKDGYKFGRKGETLSSVLGKNEKQEKLIWFGWGIVIILFLIDRKLWWAKFVDFIKTLKTRLSNLSLKKMSSRSYLKNKLKKALLYGHCAKSIMTEKEIMENAIGK